MLGGGWEERVGTRGSLALSALLHLNSPVGTVAITHILLSNTKMRKEVTTDFSLNPSPQEISLLPFLVGADQET